MLITGSTIAPRSPPNHGGGLQGRCGRHRRAGEIAAVSSRARCARACRPRPSLPRNLTPVTWTTYAEPVDRPDAVALLHDYFAELTVRYFHREMTKQEIDETSPSSRASSAPTAYPPAASAYTRRASSPASSRPAVSTSRRRPRPAHRRRVMGPPPQPHPTSSTTPAPTWSRPALICLLRSHRDHPKPPRPQAPSTTTRSRSESLRVRP